MPYGINNPNGVFGGPGFSPTLGAADAVTPTTLAYIQRSGNTQFDGEINHWLRTAGSRATRKILLTLLGVAPGQTATETRYRVKAQQALNDPTMLGGLVPIEGVGLVSRATTSADVTALTAMLSRVPAPATYPADVSGNGGGGKVGW